jgi:hypothetical protein
MTKGQSKMDNPEKPGNIGYSRRRKKTTIYVGHHYTQTNTNNVNNK